MLDAALPIDAAAQEVPRLVRISVLSQMLLVPAALAFTVFMLQPIAYPQVNALLFLAVSIVIAFIALAVLSRLLRGYGSMRHAFAVYAGILMQQFILLLPRLLGASLLTATLFVLLDLWWFAAILLLYSPSVHRWFRQNEAQRQLASNQRLERP